MPVDSVNRIGNYEINSASGSQHREQPKRERSGGQSENSDSPGKANSAPPSDAPAPTEPPAPAAASQILDSEKMVQILANSPRPASNAGRAFTSRKVSPSAAEEERQKAGAKKVDKHL